MALAITGLRTADEIEIDNPFELIDDALPISSDEVHVIREGVLCTTEPKGHATAKGASLLELVLNAPDGFIPLWAPNITLRWRFQEASLRRYRNPNAVKVEVEKLLGEALIAWGDAAPVKFVRADDNWDFEIVVRDGDECSPQGCTLARAFFPDAGRHELAIFPKIFSQPRQEQMETLAHELGHVFGLRHFFALVKETAWPAVVFGEHSNFSIMNYGADSRLTDADRADLKRLYAQVWSGQLNNINGTRIRLVTPFHQAGVSPGTMIVA
ncbi:matrix metalloproteinase-11 [Sphingomonas sp. AP4-R1]|uniref:matrixin family metalloprotease n=1 Tax=Sphingomonas sp. AP4-R1 TaxID=2735134 RepID=UPI0014932EB5|nr:matrixin family metalloprotease [Sphingomonas sp. AP4-R1]QJU56999.1 matrix metalloproteinase-11 [Sphingomonas sp. AP4-R1]